LFSFERREAEKFWQKVVASLPRRRTSLEKSSGLAAQTRLSGSWRALAALARTLLRNTSSDRNRERPVKWALLQC